MTLGKNTRIAGRYSAGQQQRQRMNITKYAYIIYAKDIKAKE